MRSSLFEKENGYNATRLPVYLAAIVLCACISGQAFGTGSVNKHLPPGSPLPPPDSPLPWQTSLYGDTPGRKSLADSGFTFWGFEEFRPIANVSGGLKTAIRPLNRTFAAANLDFEKLGWGEGGQFRASFTTYIGKNIGEDVGGTPYNPSTLYQESDIKLYQLYYGQWFADKQAHVKIGRISANEDGDFAANSIADIFDSVGYNGAPGNTYINNRAFSTVGIASWGARLRVMPDDRDYTIGFGVYNTSEDFGEISDPDEHGMNFGFDPSEAVMVAGEFVYDLNQDPGDTGLPGRYRVGALYDTGELDRLDGAGQKDGNWAFYMLFDQMVYQESPGSNEGLWVFTQFSMNPDEAINPYPYLGSWGLVYQGLFPGREKDTTAFGNYYNFSSNRISGNSEVQFDLLHNFYITSWFSIAPEIQYIIRPGGTGDIDNALVLNVQFMLLF